jgi:hypothetical protein
MVALAARYSNFRANRGKLYSEVQRPSIFRRYRFGGLWLNLASLKKKNKYQDLDDTHKASLESIVPDTAS